MRSNSRAVTDISEPEFSRPVALVRVGPEPLRQEIAATEPERTALARRFGLVAVDRLWAVVELVREGHDRVMLRAGFDAEFVQQCVVTLDPVSGEASGRFDLLYGPPEAEAEAGLDADDEIAFEPIAGGTIDIGEAVAQEFALALPPFPRCAEAEAEAGLPVAGDVSPFAALSHLVLRDTA
jgi:uncharacterized metal-binding protein YceD (DUF177 family)